METIQEQDLYTLNALIKALKIRFPGRQIAEKTGYKESTVSEYLNGKKTLSENFLRKFCEVYKVNFEKQFRSTAVVKNFQSDAIPLGEVIVDTAEQNGKNKFIDLGAGRYIMMVPVVDQYSYGGYLVGYKDPEYIEELNTQPMIVDKRHRGVYMCFEQRGDSMNGGLDPIKEGDKVIGRLIEPIYWKSKLHIHKYNEFIIVHKGGILVKQITAHDVEKGIITIHAYNENKDLYPDTQINLEDVLQLFNVVEVSKKR